MGDPEPNVLPQRFTNEWKKIIKLIQNTRPYKNYTIGLDNFRVEY